MELETVIHPFEPIYDKESKVLILGTIPSPKSREKGFYYSAPSNKFWNLIADICGCPLPDTNEGKKLMLLNHHIAIWDVFEKTKIRGYEDATIKKKNSLGTDLTRLINESKISKIYANGGKAEDGYNWFAYEKIGIPIEKLPGSGGANTHMTYAEKLEAWSVIKQYI